MSAGSGPTTSVSAGLTASVASVTSVFWEVTVIEGVEGVEGVGGGEDGEVFEAADGGGNGGGGGAARRWHMSRGGAPGSCHAGSFPLRSVQVTLAPPPEKRSAHQGLTDHACHVILHIVDRHFWNSMLPHEVASIICQDLPRVGSGTRPARQRTWRAPRLRCRGPSRPTGTRWPASAPRCGGAS